MFSLNRIISGWRHLIAGLSVVALVILAEGADAASSRPLRPMATLAGFVAPAGPFLTPLGLTRFCFAYRDQCRVSNPIFRPKRMAVVEASLKDLDDVNRSVNRAIRPQPDGPGLLNDIWTIAPAAGDCDDYAVTKRARLLKKGWSSRTLLLAQVVAANGEDHLVLVARTRLGDFVLDNLTQAVLPAPQANLRWLGMQTAANPHIWQRAAVRSYGA
ncbi:putative transglutaminase-like cysteine proteinase [Bosea sp. 124]|nr:putative transglutaminase-like cysteine proteinase [Bosea sp. 124]